MVSVMDPAVSVWAEKRAAYWNSEGWEGSSNETPVAGMATVKRVAGFYLATRRAEPIKSEPLLPAKVADEAASAADAAGSGQPERRMKPGQEWFWSDSWQAAEREADADVKAGRVETFNTMEEFLAGLE